METQKVSLEIQLKEAQRQYQNQINDLFHIKRGILLLSKMKHQINKTIGIGTVSLEVAIDTAIDEAWETVENKKIKQREWSKLIRDLKDKMLPDQNDKLKISEDKK